MTLGREGMRAHRTHSFSTGNGLHEDSAIDNYTKVRIVR